MIYANKLLFVEKYEKSQPDKKYDFEASSAVAMHPTQTVNPVEAVRRFRYPF